jgi:hypothetical protein
MDRKANLKFALVELLRLANLQITETIRGLAAAEWLMHVAIA